MGHNKKRNEDKFLSSLLSFQTLLKFRVLTCEAHS